MPITHLFSVSFAKKLWALIGCIAVLAVIFVFYDSGLDFDYVIPKRLIRLLTIGLGSVCLAFSAIIFQTVVGNRVLTPAVMGYESVYLLWQVLLLFMVGVQGIAFLGLNGNFIISVLLMLGYSWALYQYLLPFYKNDVYVLLLVGLVLSMVISTFSQFIELKMSPGEFSVLQSLTYTSFNRSELETLVYASVLIVGVLALLAKRLPILDVMSLGREQAISLGVNYQQQVRFFLAIVAVLVAVSTSLIGMTAFFGIFVANIAYALCKVNRHKFTLPVGTGIAMVIFIVSQFLVEHIFNYKTTVSILINLFGGSYFLVFILRNRSQV